MKTKINKLITKYDTEIYAFLLTILTMTLFTFVFLEMIAQAFLVTN